MDDLSQFRQTYITECFELLAEMEERLLQLDEGSTDNDALNAIFRCAHSIKGGAGAFNLTEIAVFTHILEALLDKMREGEIDAHRDVIDLLLKARDIVFQMVIAAQENRDVEAGFGNDIKEQLEQYVSVGKKESGHVPQDSASNQGGLATFHITFTPGETLLVNGNEPILLLRELSELGEATIKCDTSAIPTLDKFEPDRCYLKWNATLTGTMTEADIREVFEFVEDECTLEITREQVEKPAESPSKATEKKSPKSASKTKDAASTAQATAPAASSIRVDISKVDTLINMVGEVVITQAMLAAQTKQLPPQQFLDLISGIEELSQHTRELQEAVMAIRMQPVKSIFARMPRLVRDLADKLGKEVSLTMQGENTEVDKTIIEQLSDPLTHLIRNAVDHGIDTPTERLEAGKSREGTVILSAEHRGGRIVIEIKDDGRGINRERVLQIAIEKGLVSEDAHLTEHEIDNLIFAPGFSTAAEVSDVSGRGVGMDVVKRNIESLGGSVSVSSKKGKGSAFSITLPLTLAILDGMIVRIGQEHYIIPIAHIIETMRPRAEEVRPVANGMSVIRVRGEFIPLLYLSKLFGIKNATPEAHKALVVLVENGTEQLGLVVDELLGQQQVVIKSLEENADPIAGISGATILGDGNVSLILDVGGLCRMTAEIDNQAKHGAVA